jgi:DNA (cytosine-5)-methyltransferase 1
LKYDKSNICCKNNATEKQKLTMIELFSGIGAQKEGTDLTGVFDCEVVATADIEKDAMVSYAAIHDGLTNEMVKEYSDYPSEEQMRKELMDKNIGFDFKKGTNPIARVSGEKLKKYYLAMIISKNLGDISKIAELPLADFWTYSSPCQDWSVAGKQEGGNWTCLSCEYEYNPISLDVHKRYICPKCGSENIKSTRSGLLFEVERLLVKAKETNTLPKYLLLENVKNLVSKSFKEYFDEWLVRLDELGFNTYWSVVNAKDCGIAQNRERVFAVSIRKDVDTKQFEFMKPFDLGLRLRDFLDTDVDEKYYLSQEIQDRLQITDETFEKNIVGTTKGEACTRFGQRDLVYQKDGIMGCLTATDYKQPKQILEDNTNRCIQAGNLSGGKWDKIYESARRYYDENGIAPTIHTCGGGNTEPKVEQSEHSKWKDEMYSNFINDSDEDIASGVYTNQSKAFGYRPPMEGLSKTLKANANDAGVVYKKRVRKLTPIECYRLMGFSDECYDKALSVGLSDSAGYKQAGNSIVTYCIKGIMEHLYKAQYDSAYICFDENFTKPQVE